jgi:hypothetical protein
MRCKPVYDALSDELRVTLDMHSRPPNPVMGNDYWRQEVSKFSSMYLTTFPKCHAEHVKEK